MILIIYEIIEYIANIIQPIFLHSHTPLAFRLYSVLQTAVAVNEYRFCFIEDKNNTLTTVPIRIDK